MYIRENLQPPKFVLHQLQNAVAMQSLAQTLANTQHQSGGYVARIMIRREGGGLSYQGVALRDSDIFIFAKRRRGTETEKFGSQAHTQGERAREDESESERES